ncbi:MAG: 3-hydroxyacyl-CoA dehydrogenase [Proteobacteria bacterium]|nr:3-hydroxyacyl-CoA dehydrogenase [Pseudomonadota bacterium]
MRIESIKKILILGAGTMGQQIGFVCALHGYDVVIYDISETMLATAEKYIRKSTGTMGLYGAFTPQEYESAVKRIQYTSNPKEAADGVDLVNESVPEDPGLKGQIFSQFNALCPPDTIFTTNTSSLVPSMFAQATGRPDKFCALHFHVVNMTKIVDVMPHPGTSSETLETVIEFAKRIGQIPIALSSEHYGYVYNHMLMSLLDSALSIASRGVATVEDIDRSWMGVMNTAIGPFGIMDSIGLMTSYKITDFWANVKKDKKAMANAAFIKQYVDQGKLGIKTGEGFYSYPNPSYAHPAFISSNV